ncbi:cytochrome c [Polaribacter sp. KT25b]|uniref:c-type cytochrome n=1 Tax=Polaribacter sp. KT25b TaxID=1855336 RepID=UPI00087965CD|nr:c-type cytochrome [Polaribacter sp. KT25b]SDR99959.1 cytochrome c [Polaribacter sp. KT25b]
MKKVIFSLAFIVCVSFLIVSFTEKKEILNTIPQSSIDKGKRLFKKNACTGCHQEKTKVIGPSVKDIATKYKTEKGDLIAFLKGKNKPIVDKDPGQIAIMNASLGITKNMKAVDLKALYDYIMSIK